LITHIIEMDMKRLVAREEALGGLECAVIDFGPDPDIAVILCHGYGAPGGDLVGLAEAITDLLEDTAERFRFVFPVAPLQPAELADFGGRAWWEINMAALLAASQSQSFDQLHDKTPPGMERAREALAHCIREVLQQLGEDGRYVLGGFSQGAMVTMDVALSGEVPPPALLVQFSGTLVRKPQWQDALLGGRLARTAVLQSHGRQDPILPFSSAESLHRLVKASQPDAEFIAFHGPHSIPMEAIANLALRLRRLAS
jgi:phospholipase/carboxylesterase